MNIFMNRNVQSISVKGGSYFIIEPPFKGSYRQAACSEQARAIAC